MRLDFSNYEQVITFLLSIVLGVGFCLVYDVLRFLHKTRMKGNVAVFIGDVLYFSVISVATFCFFLLFSKGVIRIYVYIGEILGFFICRITISRLFLPTLLVIDKYLNKILKLIFLPLIKLGGFICEKIWKIFEKLKDFRASYKKKRAQNKEKSLEKRKKRKKFKKVEKNP